MSKDNEIITVFYVFTFQEVLQKIFLSKEKAEIFKKVYCKRGLIREYTIDDNFMGDIIKNEFK